MASIGDSYSEGQGQVDCSGVRIPHLLHMSDGLDGHRLSSDHVRFKAYPSWPRRRSVLKGKVVKAAISYAS